MADFSKVACMVPTAGANRWTSAYAAITNILLNTKNNSVYICYNNEDVPENIYNDVDILRGLAVATSNVLEFLIFNENESKSQMMMKVASWAERGKLLMNVDDDFLVPGYTFQLIKRALDEKDDAVFIYGLMDVLNKRNHIDWDNTVYATDYNSIADLVRKWGKKILPHRIYASPTTPVSPITVEIPHDAFLMHSDEDLKRNHGAGSWIIPLQQLWAHPELCERLSRWDKRQKGEDVIIVNALGKRIGVQWIVGSNSFHTDWNAKELDNPTWDNHLPFDDSALDL